MPALSGEQDEEIVRGQQVCYRSLTVWNYIADEFSHRWYFYHKVHCAMCVWERFYLSLK